MTSDSPVLEVEELTVAYSREGIWFEAVREVSLKIRAGETYGLVGESGSGKTTLALAVMRYLGENASIRHGRVLLSGRDLLSLSPGELRKVWGRQIRLVPQHPGSALNPSLRVGEQLAESLRHQFGFDSTSAHLQVLEWFNRVGLADPERVSGSYPHQISGGMQQRILIALALSAEPELLILDEPTTSLDVTTQAAILDLVKDLTRDRHTSVLYVTHNLGVVADICDRVAVLYAGELVEESSGGELFSKPLHPYTYGLLDSVPRLGESKHHTRLRSITGVVPGLGEIPSGCVFRERCPLAIDLCEIRPPCYAPSGDRQTRCHRWEEILREDVDPRQNMPMEMVKSPRQDGSLHGSESARLPDRGPNLNVKSLEVHFPLRRSPGEVIRRAKPVAVRAVNQVDFEIPGGHTLGLVGESGSGKTTVARAIVGLVPKTGGEIELLSFPLPDQLAKRDLNILQQLQMVFQDPEQAFNPYLTIREALRRPLVRLLGLSAQEADRRVDDLLEAVRLNASYAGRHPGQLSGGELQRVAIARAFAASPSVLICDEPVSSLDVSVQAAILNLLNELQVEHGSSLLFISHDLAVVGYLADEIAVIYLGHLMQVASAGRLFEPPYHPYTEALLSAIPDIDPRTNTEPIRLRNEIPRPTNLPSGCPFHTRCPRFLGDICVQETPPWRVVPDGESSILCHIPVEELLEMQTKSGPKNDL
jgi:peptide/nickel transport system ATP-binding protein